MGFIIFKIIVALIVGGAYQNIFTVIVDAEPLRPWLVVFLMITQSFFFGWGVLALLGVQ